MRLRERAESNEEMIREQLIARGVTDHRVIEAFRSVPRDVFVPLNLRASAYDDTPLPLTRGQTISQPFIVGFMTEMLQLRGDEKVLEIGTGSGYQTSILAELAGAVISIERIASLAEGARTLLTELGYGNVAIHVGDGTTGWADAAPYDRIVVTAAAPRVPPPLLVQLSPAGGLLVIPVGDPQDQYLLAVSRDGDRIRQRSLGPVRFVPLVGRAGWAAQFQENGHSGPVG
jgi:protein-L-isoaspartate(D-aspartate) O-methyltransferase